MNKRLLILLCLVVQFTVIYSQPRQVDSRDHVVMLSAETQKSPLQIKLKWLKNELASQYRIVRKALNEQYWSSGNLAILDSNATEFIDKSIQPGIAYEYEVQAYSYASAGTNQFNFWGFGYIICGVDVPAFDNPGKVILLIDSTIKDKLATEIKRLKEDLRAEGWGIIEHYVPRVEKFDGNQVKYIKSLILADYESDPMNIKSVFLLGRVAVPYSGNMNPDGHEDHIGAWPADVYYGYTIPEFNWTDATVNISSAKRTENRNIPGDGKFDQNLINGNTANLSVGRVDLYDMPLFHNGLTDPETDLIRKYLDKNHKYRNGLMEYNRGGIIDDNFGASSYIEGFAAGGWRNFSVLTTPNNVRKADWFTTLSTESNLFAYGCGGGTYTSAGGVGNTNDFATKQVKTVFPLLFGSYFGDWDIQNSFLRAPLASDPMALICAWVARPQWYLHHMSYGYPIGYSARISHNNTDLYKSNIIYTSQYPNGVIYVIGLKNIHTALMGDPTLKLNPADVDFPKEVSIYQTTGNNGKSVMIKWKKPSTNKSPSFNIYRSTEEFGLYKKLNNEPIFKYEYEDVLTGDEFDRFDGDVYYMVRTIVEDNNNSGDFYNISRGEIAKSFISNVNEDIIIKDIVSLSPNPASEKLSINLNLSVSGETNVQIIDLNGNIIRNLFKGFLNEGNQVISWNLTDDYEFPVANGIYYLKIQTINGISIKPVSIIK